MNCLKNLCIDFYTIFCTRINSPHMIPISTNFLNVTSAVGRTMQPSAGGCCRLSSLRNHYSQLRRREVYKHLRKPLPLTPLFPVKPGLRPKVRMKILGVLGGLFMLFVTVRGSAECKKRREL